MSVAQSIQSLIFEVTLVRTFMPPVVADSFFKKRFRLACGGSLNPGRIVQCEPSAMLER